MNTTPFTPQQVAEFENQTWSRCAHSYTEGFGALVGEAIAPLLDGCQVVSGDHLLDVGSGTGLLAAAAHKRGAKVVGLDFSLSMLAEARRLHANIDFRHGKAEQLPFDDGQFDAVLGNFLLHHCGEPESVLAEVFRVLRSGGKTGFTVWAEPAKLHAFGLFFATIEEFAGSAELPHGPLFGVSDFAVFEQLLTGAGFNTVKVSELPIVWKTPDIDSYITAFRDWANLSAFSDDIQQSVAAAVKNRAEEYKTAKGFVIPNPALLIVAEK